MVIYTPMQGPTTLELERYHVDGLDDPAANCERFRARFAMTTRALFYDPLSPEPAQRNRGRGDAAGGRWTRGATIAQC